MLVETMRAAIAGARTLAQLDALTHDVWRAWGSGAVDDAGAQSLAELAKLQKDEVRGRIVPVGIPAGRPSLFPPRRLVKSPDRLASRDRRRTLAASGPMPPQLARGFTTGQLAVLRIIGDEVAAHGVCGLCIDAIAARAGVCRRLAQGALRLAAGDGLLVIVERRHEGRKNDPNLIRIISREWSAWLKRARRLPPRPPLAEAETSRKVTGCKSLHPTDRGSSSTPVESGRNVANAAEGQRSPSTLRPIRNRSGWERRR